MMKKNIMLICLDVPMKYILILMVYIKLFMDCIMILCMKDKMETEQLVQMLMYVIF